MTTIGDLISTKLSSGRGCQIHNYGTRNLASTLMVVPNLKYIHTVLWRGTPIVSLIQLLHGPRPRCGESDGIITSDSQQQAFRRSPSECPYVQARLSTL